MIKPTTQRKVIGYTNQERADEIKGQIKDLQDELASLAIPNIASLINTKRPSQEVWDCCVKLVKSFWREDYKRGQKISFKDFSIEQTKLCADFLNEIIPIYNRYFDKGREIKK